MRTLGSITIGLLTWTILGSLQPAASLGDEPASIATESVDVVARGPRFETEPVETNSNVDLEADTRDKEYTLRPLPTGAPLPTLEFVCPGAGDSGHAARITAEAGQAGILTRTIPADKGHRITFSVKIRSERIESVGLVAVPLSRRPQRRRPTGPDTRRVRRPPGPFLPRNSAPRAGPGPHPPRGLAIARSKTLSGSFDWTTLSLDTALTGNIDEAQFQVVVRGPGTVWIDDFSVAVHWPKIVATPKEPAAPLLVMVLMHSETPQAYIRDRDYFRADAMKYEEMAKMLNRYGARLVAQPEREIWLGARRYDPDWLRRLHDKYKVSFSVHTHGPNPRMNPTRQEVLDYIKLRKDELEAMGGGHVTDLNGNFDQQDWDLFAEIGIRTMTAYKNVRTQMGQMAMKHDYRHPWRPAGSPYRGEEAWAQHRPECRIVYLPGAGAVHTRHHARFADLMQRHLRVGLSRVRADRVNVFYFVEHVGRFVSSKPGQSPWEYVNSQAFRDDLKQHEKLYRDFLAPLVKSGHVRYVVPSEACDLFEQWERKMGIAAAGTANPTAQDAGGTLESDDVKGYITFAINTHDWMHVNQSAEILLRLIGLYEKHGVRGDFYLTAPMTHHYAESRPDVIRRLRDSKMTISYHVRPPHILYPGFNGRLRELDDHELAKTLRDYETYRLDMTSGELLRDQGGGYQYVAETFRRKPVALGVPTGSPRERTAARRNYRELGASVIVEHHESGTKPDRPFEWVDGLLIRPSDFSVTRWAATGDQPGRRGLGNFWWNMLSTPRAADYNPTAYLKRRLAEWNGPRPPIITCLIHENNFYRARSTPWALVYYADIRKPRPLKAPFDLSAPDASVARSAADRRAIWRAYEKLVAYAAANLKVVTSEDVARIAESVRQPDVPNADRGPARRREERRVPLGAGPPLTIFCEGAPVMVRVLGGFGPGGYVRGLRGVVSQGIVQITYNYPGGQTGPFVSHGVYDYRGMNCIRATRDVIRFALGELTPVHQPRQPFDRNRNGKIDADEDWAFASVAQYEGDQLKVYYSREVLDAAHKKNVFGEAGPPDFLPTPKEYKDYWKLRDSLPALPLLKKHNPDLKVILVAGQVDHVQACPAFPGIQQAYDGLGEAGVWRRINPDAAYVRSIAGNRIQGPIGDNDANLTIPVGQMRRFAHPADSGVPKPLFQLAAVLELADRVQFENEKPNLDGVLCK